MVIWIRIVENRRNMRYHDWQDDYIWLFSITGNVNVIKDAEITMIEIVVNINPEFVQILTFTILAKNLYIILILVIWLPDIKKLI